MMLSTLKRVAFWLVLGTLASALGGCSLKSLGAGLLSEALGGTSPLTAVNSGLGTVGTVVNQLTGSGT